MDKNFKKYKKIIFAFFIFSFFSFLPIQSYASIIGTFAAWAANTVLTIYLTGVIILVLLQVALLALGSINTAIANLLLLLISPGAIGWKYTDPAQNPFINTGLNITGGFVSIGLVLAMVWIALATILRLEGYNTGKLLIKLIVAALLVYFAPVICGLIVDAANIFMYYFADKIGGINLLAATSYDVAANLAAGILTIPILGQIGPIAASILLIIFQLMLSMALFTFFMVFLFRVVAIWLAVILAPIAFICWILPATQRWWNWWWGNFIKWVLCGPIFCFFLYLSAVLGNHIESGGLAYVLPIFSGDISNVLNPVRRILPHLLTMGALYLGIILGLRGTGMGGNIALGLVARARGGIERRIRGKIRPARIVGGAVTGAAQLVVGPDRVERLRTRLQEWGTREATLPTPGTGVPGRRGLLIRTAAAPIWALRRKVGEMLGPAQIEYQKQMIEEEERKTSGKSVEKQLALYRKARTDVQRLGVLRAMVKDRNIERAMDVTRFGANAIQLTEIPQIYQLAARLEKEDLLRAAFPEIARNHLRALPPGTPGAPPLPVLPPGLSPQARAREIQLHYARAALERIRANDFENMTSRVLRDDIFLEALVTAGTPEQLEAFVRRFGPRGSEAFRDTLINASLRYGRPAVTFLRDRNPILFQYIRRPGRASRLLTPEIADALAAYSPTQVPPGQPPPPQPPKPPSPPQPPPPPQPPKPPSPPQPPPPAQPPKPPSLWPTSKSPQPPTKPPSSSQTPPTGPSKKESTQSGFPGYRSRRSAPRPGPFE